MPRPNMVSLLVAGLGAASLGAGLVALVILGSTGPAATVTVGGQVLADVAVVASAGAVAWRTRGRTRLIWGLICAAFVAWLLSDAAYLAQLASGGASGGASVADVGWVVFAVLMFAVVALLYAHVRPERGWQGVLDAIALAAALGAIGWALMVGPANIVDRLGAVEAGFALSYPVVAIGTASVIGWLVLRTGGGPTWLRIALLGMLLLAAGEVTYLALSAGGSEGPLIPAWLLFAASSWTWALAALSRLEAGESAWADHAREAPPAWSDAVPSLAMLGAVAVVAWPAGPLGAAVVAIVSVVAVRFTVTNRINARLSSEMSRKALTDPLTGALNRRSLDARLPELVDLCRRQGLPLSALAIDLDHFKGVNDGHGHLAGDRLLVEVVAALDGELREGDLLFRVGGDEFVALLPATAAGEARRVADRLRAVVGRIAREHRADGLGLSVGLAEGPPRRSSPTTLLIEADRALYRAKAEGRDRTVHSPPPRPSGAESTIAETPPGRA